MSKKTKKFRLLVDGRECKVDSNVTVVYDSLILDGEDGEEVAAELHVQLTSEGVIEDVWVGDDCVATSSEMAQEIVERLSD
jgi:hypothetical protein